MPFGALQFILIHLASWLVVRSSRKSIFLAIVIAPVIVGSGILFGVERVESNKGVLLFGYCESLREPTNCTVCV